MKPNNSLLLIVFSLSAMLLTSCQGSSDGKSKFGQWLLFSGASSTTVTPTGGGTVKAASMSLTVPQGAVEEETTISFTKIAVPEGKDSIVPLQAAYQFGPENLQFNKPATLTICYDAQSLAADGLQEKTMQIQYYDEESGEFISMGGDVDMVHHCVSAPVYHFSAYVLTAQLLSIGNAAPTIGGATFFPGTPIAGQPVTVRSSITDWNAGSAIATVRLYYRRAGTGLPFQSIAMNPEANDPTGQFYTAKVSGSAVTASGLDYYIEAHDSLNAGRTLPATAPAAYNTIAGDTPDATTPIRFQTAVTQMSAGFSRDLTVQLKGSSSPTFYPVPAETLTFAGDKGVTSRPTWLSARYTAQIIGTSYLQASYGTLNVSMQINVYPGVLNRIVLLYNDAELPDPLEVDGNSVTQIDAAGYDAYDNFMFVQPVFTATPTDGGPSIGTFGDPANYGRFLAGNVFPERTGTITATVGGYSVTYNVVVHSTWIFCQFDTGIFDNGTDCVFN